VRISVLNTEAGYRVRPAFTTAHVTDTIRFLNLTGEDIYLRLPNGLRLAGNPTLANGDHRDANILPAGLDHPQGTSPTRRWQVHYSVFRSKSFSLIPGESSPEIIIDEEA
jgi:hypothetical protein